MMDIVNGFIELTRHFETPTNFWRWSAYAMIAGVLRNSVYLEHGVFRRTYPNIYVVLLAASAESRKSGPFAPVQEFLHKSGRTKVFAGRISIQQLLTGLAEDSPKKLFKGQTHKGGSGTIIAEEFASFFVEDPQFIPILTDIYDSRDMFEYALKSGQVVIKDMCVTMLAASNETFLQEIYNNRAIYGGLLGRTFMVRPDEVRPPNSMLDVVDMSKEKDFLMVDIQQLEKLKGPMTISPDAKKEYETWYTDLYTKYKKINDRTGVIQRMHTGVLKISIILAASNGMMTITKEHMIEAILQVTGLRANYAVYAMSAGKGTKAEIGALLLNSLYAAAGRTLTRREVLTRHWQEMDSEELEKLVETLRAAELISVGSKGKDITYTITDKCVEMFNKSGEGA
jgi:hypothetical protein